jgi:ribosome maturation factor RimP
LPFSLKSLIFAANIALNGEGTESSLFLFIDIILVIEQTLSKLLTEKFSEADFNDCFLVEIKVHQNKKVEVFVDSDSSLTLDRCRQISRFLEKHIDENGWLGEKYTLEVSSPGIGRPLQFLRQYTKNIGRKVEVALLEGETKTGTLVQANEQRIMIEEKLRIKEGKKKKTVIKQTEIPFSDIQETKVKISFK